MFELDLTLLPADKWVSCQSRSASTRARDAANASFKRRPEDAFPTPPRKKPLPQLTKDAGVCNSMQTPRALCAPPVVGADDAGRASFRERCWWRADDAGRASFRERCRHAGLLYSFEGIAGWLQAQAASPDCKPRASVCVPSVSVDAAP